MSWRSEEIDNANSSAIEEMESLISKLRNREILAVETTQEFDGDGRDGRYTIVWDEISE